jgi:hypothetical protein
MGLGSQLFAQVDTPAEDDGLSRYRPAVYL